MKKGISPVVASTLFLVVAVISIVTFQGWFATFSSNIFYDAETTGKLSNVNIENIIDETLYIVSNDDNVSISSISINGAPCEIPSILNKGLNQIEITSCLNEISNSVVDIVLVNEKSVISKSIFLDNIIRNLISIFTGTVGDPIVPRSTLDGIRDIQVIGNYAYVTSRATDYFSVLDISDKNNLVEIGSYSGNHLIGEFVIDGNYAYISSISNRSVTVLDISNPMSITLVDYFENSSSLGGEIKVIGNYAYVISLLNDRFTVLDISVPSSVSQTFSFLNSTSMNEPNFFEIKDSNAYVISRISDTLTTLNISDPNNIIQIGSFVNSSSIYYPSDLKIIGDTAVLSSSSDNGFKTFNISDPSNIVQMSDQRSLYESEEFIYNSGIGYASNSDGEVIIYNFSNLNLITVIDYTDYVSAFHNIDYSDGHIYVTDYYSENILNFNVTNQTLEDENSFGDGRLFRSANEFEVIDDIAYVLGYYDFYIMDVSDPSNIVELGKFANVSYMYAGNDLKIDGNLAYISVGSLDSLLILNFSDVSNISIAGNFSNSTGIDNPRDFEIRDGIVYIPAKFQNRVTTLNVSNPSNIVQLDSILDSTYLDGSTDIEISGDFAYLAGDDFTDRYFNILNISDPNNISILSSLENSTNFYGVADIEVSGDYAYVASKSSDMITVVDISNSSNPYILDFFYNSTILNDINDIEIEGNYLVAINNYFAGEVVSVFDISNPSNLTLVSFLDDDFNLDQMKIIEIENNLLYTMSYKSLGVFSLE